MIAALRKLRTVPDALMHDGHGVAHPRRFGIASHVGVLVGLPTVGCAKRVLVGAHRPRGPRRGATTPLVDRGERIGIVLRTQDGVRPVFVSGSTSTPARSWCWPARPATGCRSRPGSPTSSWRGSNGSAPTERAGADAVGEQVDRALGLDHSLSASSLD